MTFNEICLINLFKFQIQHQHQIPHIKIFKSNKSDFSKSGNCRDSLLIHLKRNRF